MSEETKGPRGTGKRVAYPPEFVAEVDKLEPDERRLRLRRHLEEHGEDTNPGEGYGPKVPRDALPIPAEEDP